MSSLTFRRHCNSGPRIWWITSYIWVYILTINIDLLADFTDNIIMATSDEGVRYRNKVTIVTGGARGIGRACVELFGKFLFSKVLRRTLIAFWIKLINADLNI